MNNINKREGKFIFIEASLVRKAWLDIFLSILAILMIVMAIYIYWARLGAEKRYKVI